MDFFNREKVLEMFRHAYDSYMVSFRTQAPFVIHSDTVITQTATIFSTLLFRC